MSKAKTIFSIKTSQGHFLGSVVAPMYGIVINTNITMKLAKDGITIQAVGAAGRIIFISRLKSEKFEKYIFSGTTPIYTEYNIHTLSDSMKLLKKKDRVTLTMRDDRLKDLFVEVVTSGSGEKKIKSIPILDENEPVEFSLPTFDRSSPNINICSKTFSKVCKEIVKIKSDHVKVSIGSSSFLIESTNPEDVSNISAPFGAEGETPIIVKMYDAKHFEKISRIGIASEFIRVYIIPNTQDFCFVVDIANLGEQDVYIKNPKKK